MNETNIPGIWFPKIYEATKLQKRLDKIETLNELNFNDFKENFARKSFPFILKNQGISYFKSKALKTLLNSFSEYLVSVRFGDMSNPSNYINRRTAEMPLKEFIEDHFLQTSNSEIAYAGSSTITNDFLSTLNIEYPNFYPADFYNSPRLWLGRAGTITHLHKDIPDNFAFNYFGTKKWIIYPPKDYPFLYMTNPNEKEYPDFGASLVNLANPDLQTFPDFANAKPTEFILTSGDMLYLPAGWSHFVENTEDTLMINFWLKREKSPAILGNDK